METLQTMTELKIRLDKVTYDKKSKVLAIDIPGITFIGNYTKNTRISIILNDIHKVIEQKGIKINRNDVDFFNENTLQNIHGNTKLKKLMKLKEEPEVETIAKSFKMEKPKVSSSKSKKKGSRMRKNMPSPVRRSEATEKMDIEMVKEREVFYEEVESEADEEELMVDLDDNLAAPVEIEDVRKSSIAPPPPPASGGFGDGGPPAPGGPPPPKAPKPAPMVEAKAKRAGESRTDMKDILMSELEGEKAEDVGQASQKETEYHINMGLQYYSVMMEKKSYLFYVYFSHQELKIVDEEGKTVYTTTIKIVTKKKEPPVMDLTIEGEGFEAHPLSGKVEVNKKAVNPPVMIFSVMPTKSKVKKKIKESERRFLNVYIDFEGKRISSTTLSIIVQPKHFKMKLGPLTFNLNKGTAIAVTIISIAISVLLVGYSILTFDFTDFTGVGILTNIVPQISSIIFVILFIYTIYQGIYPIKQQFAGLLNFDQGSIEK